MAAAEDFMGVAVTSPGAILAVVAMDGAAAAMGGVVVTGEVGTVVVGMDGVGMAVAGTGAIGMAAVPTGGGVTHTRMDMGLTVGKSDKQKNLNRGWTQIYADKERPSRFRSMDSGAKNK